MLAARGPLQLQMMPIWMGLVSAAADAVPAFDTITVPEHVTTVAATATICLKRVFTRIPPRSPSALTLQC
jgi:hypothetical protein